MNKPYVLIFLFLSGLSIKAQITKNMVLPTDHIGKVFNPTLLTCPDDSQVDCFDLEPSYISEVFEWVNSKEGIVGIPSCLSCDLEQLQVRDQVEEIEQGIRQVKRTFYIEQEGNKGVAFGACVQNILQVDQERPVSHCVSISTSLMETPVNYPRPIVELWACDFNVGSYDRCTIQDELLYTFDNIPPVADSIIYLTDTSYHINLDVSHFFNRSGFIDFNGDGTRYPKAKASTINKYNLGQCYKWTPDTKCTGKMFTCDDAPKTQIRVDTWDEALNSDFCIVEMTFGGVVDDCICDEGDSHLIADEFDGLVTLYQNNPNPFKDQTTINWLMQIPCTASLSVFDVSGRVLYTSTKGYTKGFHSVTLSREDLQGASGVLYYQLKLKRYAEIKKMIMLD